MRRNPWKPERCSQCGKPMNKRQEASAVEMTCPTCRNAQAEAERAEQARTGMKTCARCLIRKPLGDFGSDARRPDGLFPYCKLCRRQPHRVSQTEKSLLLIGTENFSDHPLKGTWHGMIWRCENPRHEAYARYGGRGIKIYGPWHDPVIFIRDILSEIGPRPRSRTLDRINNDGNYEPGNVRWATAGEQVANSQRAKDARVRREIVRQLLDQGLTWMQITEAIGASKWSIRRDIQVIRGQSSVTTPDQGQP